MVEALDSARATPLGDVLYETEDVMVQEIDIEESGLAVAHDGDDDMVAFRDVHIQEAQDVQNKEYPSSSLTVINDDGTIILEAVNGSRIEIEEPEALLDSLPESE